MFRKTGAEIIVEMIRRQGITVVAGIPGGANLPLYDALYHAEDIRHVLARHEQAAGFIAQGMARVIGTPQVCLATSGPGATNLLTAVADAMLDSIPIVAITGQVPLAMIGGDAFQEVDTYGMSVPITKHNFLVRSAAELLRVVPEAFRIASSGRPGPVLIDVPKDVQLQVTEFDEWPEPGRPSPVPPADPGLVARAAEIINGARRPILYVGGGAVHSGAADLVVQLAERASLPSTLTLMALGAIPAGHPLNLGMLGMHAARFTNMALERCDVLIAAGVRFDDRATGKLSHFCPEARVVHIDVDASELGKLRRPQVAIAADLGQTLQAMLPMIDATPRAEWREEVAGLKRSHPLVMPAVDSVRSPYGLIRRVADLVGEDAIVATDVGQHQMWTAQAYPLKRPRRWLTSGGLGTMGFGLPAAIGAALAEPQRPVVCFSGDGSLLMNIQELATAAEEGVGVKLVLFNNNSLGLVRQQQSLFYGQRLHASDYRTRVDFVRVAEGLGVRAFDLALAQSPAAMLDEALAADGPCLIHAPVDREEMVYPMVPPGAANKDMIGGQSHVATNA